MNQLTDLEIQAIKDEAERLYPESQSSGMKFYINDIKYSMRQAHVDAVTSERQKVKGLLEAAQEIHDYLNETHYENGKPVQRNLIGANSILHNNLQTALANYNQSIKMTYGITIPVSSCEAGDHDIIPILGFENSIIGEQCRKCGKEFK